MSENGNHILRIYVSKHCWSCEEALRLAAEVRSNFAKLVVEVIDLDAEGSVNHDDVFSTPTYVLDGRTISLGNPSSEELFAKLSVSLGVTACDAALPGCRNIASRFGRLEGSAEPAEQTDSCAEESYR